MIVSIQDNKRYRQIAGSAEEEYYLAEYSPRHFSPFTRYVDNQ